MEKWFAIAINNKTVKYFTVLLLMLVTNCISAQRLNSLYSNQISPMPFGSIKPLNGNYYVTGTTLTTGSPYYEKAVFGKIDADGTVGFIHLLVDSNTVTYALFTNALKKTTDGNFVTTGYYTDSTDHTFLMKTDTAGNILLWHTYSAPLVQIFDGMDVLEIPGCGYLIVIDDVHIDNTVETLVIRTDTSGGELSQHVYTGTSWAFPRVISRMNNGHFMIGIQNDKTTGQTPYWTQTWLIEIDSMGNMMRQWLDSDRTNSGPFGMLQTPDSGWIITRQHLAYDTSNFQAYNCSVIKLDKNFNKQWEIDTGAPDPMSGFYDVQILNDGSYICVGGFGVQITPDSSHSYGSIMKISSTGQAKWFRNYLANDTFGTSGYLYSVDIMPNGDILACGEFDFTQDVGIYPIQQGWILRTDSNGCLIDNCWSVDIHPVETNNLINVKVYPNPANNNLTVETPYIIPDGLLQVIDNLGRVIQQQTLTSSNTLLPFYNQPAGIYYVRVSDANGILGVNRVVVMH